LPPKADIGQADCDVIVCYGNTKPTDTGTHNPLPSSVLDHHQQMVLRLGTTQPWCRSLWRHPALLFDVVGTDGGAQELSPSKPIPANTTALVQGPGRQHISLAMRLNKHTRDAL